MRHLPTTSAPRPHRTVVRATVALASVGVLALSACGSDDDGESSDSFATADVHAADGNSVGSASFRDADGASALTVDLTGLQPGMYGMHVHGIGTCDPGSHAPDDPSETGDFLSSGGHMGADGHDHPGHGGELPALLVNGDGTAHMTVTTDRVTRDNLLDDDGSALIIHEKPDNYGNIPDRYAPDGPDKDTLKTGDAGGRQACGTFTD